MLSRLFGRALLPQEEWVLEQAYPANPGPAPPPLQHKLIRHFGKKGSSKGCFNMPTGIAVTSMGDIVVVDSENSRLQIFSPDGCLKSRIGEKGCLPHQLNHPMAVTISRDGDENYIVTDSVNAALKVFMSDGTFMTQFGGSGMFDFPYGVAVTSNHYIIVSDVCQHSIMVLYPSGSLRNKFGQYGDGMHNLDHPYFVAVDSQDEIIVADSGNTCVKRFNIDGQLLQCFNLRDFRLFNEHFVLLAGITVDAEDNVIVIGNATVYLSAPNGRLWEAILPAEGLHSPKALAYSPLGQLAVTQCGLDNRHEVCLFSYNPQDYRSLHSVPRVVMLNRPTNGLESQVRPMNFEQVIPCAKAKRSTKHCTTAYTCNGLEEGHRENQNGRE